MKDNEPGVIGCMSEASPTCLYVLCLFNQTNITGKFFLLHFTDYVGSRSHARTIDGARLCPKITHSIYPTVTVYALEEFVT